LLAVVLSLGITSVALAASFGNKYSGASSTEHLQFWYTGSAWNYDESPIYTYFSYSRNGKVLMNKIAYTGKVEGTVTDDIRLGDKYTTHFYWGRGLKK
jgi:hypothetical protein